MKPFGLYLVVTNPLTSYEICAEAAVEAGLLYVQLRMKDASRAEILERAWNLRSITRGTATRFIVNDDPELAAEVEADGVHLGQDDGNLAEFRAKFPSLRYFGLSTHNPAQAEAAPEVSPDYIGVGPVFATPTKAIADPVLGIEAACRIIRSTPIPAVAIGGIDLTNLRDVLSGGAENFAVVRQVCRSRTPFDEIRRLQDIWSDFHG